MARARTQSDVARRLQTSIQVSAHQRWVNIRMGETGLT